MFDQIQSAIESRREKFTEAVESRLGETPPVLSEEMIVFGMRALRAAEYGMTDFQHSLWVNAACTMATEPPASWMSLLAILEAGQIERIHITLLKLFSKPADVHSRFNIPVPSHLPPLYIFQKVLAQLNLQFDQSEIQSRWEQLANWGLARTPQDFINCVYALSDYTEDLGKDFLRLCCDTAPLEPTPTLQSSKPKKTPTNLKWLAAERPNEYELVEAK